MGYLATEKLEIIRLVESFLLPAKQILDRLGIPRTTFCRWYDRFLEGGVDGLEVRVPMPSSVYNRIPVCVRTQLLNLALECPELSLRELAVRFTDTKGYFGSVYPLLKAHDLITSPAHIVMKVTNEFKDKPTAGNQ